MSELMTIQGSSTGVARKIINIERIIEDRKEKATHSDINQRKRAKKGNFEIHFSTNIFMGH